MVGNEPEKPSRRRRVTALLSQQAFAQLERIAARTGRTNAAVAEWLLSRILNQENVEPTISHLTVDDNEPAAGSTDSSKQQK